MFNFLRKSNSTCDLFAPVSGMSLDISSVPDKVFAQKVLGDGIAFNYEDNVVCAPSNGKIIMIADTLHAFGMEADNGAELIIHIGMDTVNLNGQGFKKLAEVGDKVKKGTPVIEIDREFMKEKGIDLTTPMIVTNGDSYQLSIQEAGQPVKAGETVLITCTKK